MHRDQNYKLHWQWLAQACRIKSTLKWQWSVPRSHSFLLREGFLLWLIFHSRLDERRRWATRQKRRLPQYSCGPLGTYRRKQATLKKQHLKEAGHFLSRTLILNSNPSPHCAHDEEASVYLIKPKRRIESGLCIDSDAPLFATKRLITK